jgi:hypothetical protein
MHATWPFSTWNPQIYNKDRGTNGTGQLIKDMQLPKFDAIQHQVLHIWCNPQKLSP